MENLRKNLAHWINNHKPRNREVTRLEDEKRELVIANEALIKENRNLRQKLDEIRGLGNLFVTKGGIMHFGDVTFFESYNNIKDELGIKLDQETFSKDPLKALGLKDNKEYITHQLNLGNGVWMRHHRIGDQFFDVKLEPYRTNEGVSTLFSFKNKVKAAIQISGPNTLQDLFMLTMLCYEDEQIQIASQHLDVLFSITDNIQRFNPFIRRIINNQEDIDLFYQSVYKFRENAYLFEYEGASTEKLYSANYKKQMQKLKRVFWVKKFKEKEKADIAYSAYNSIPLRKSEVIKIEDKLLVEEFTGLQFFNFLLKLHNITDDKRFAAIQPEMNILLDTLIIRGLKDRIELINTYYDFQAKPQEYYSKAYTRVEEILSKYNIKYDTDLLSASIEQLTSRCYNGKLIRQVDRHPRNINVDVEYIVRSLKNRIGSQLLNDGLERIQESKNQMRNLVISPSEYHEKLEDAVEAVFSAALNNKEAYFGHLNEIVNDRDTFIHFDFERLGDLIFEQNELLELSESYAWRIPLEKRGFIPLAYLALEKNQELDAVNALKGVNPRAIITLVGKFRYNEMMNFYEEKAVYRNINWIHHLDAWKDKEKTNKSILTNREIQYHFLSLNWWLDIIKKTRQDNNIDYLSLVFHNLQGSFNL